MKKKMTVLLCVLILLIGTALYFKPLSLSNIINRNTQISMMLNQFVIKNGTIHPDIIQYNPSSEEFAAIASVLEKSTYQRTFSTLFSNGSMSDLGHRTLSIYLFDVGSSMDNIFLSSSEQIAVGGKTYRIKNAEQLIDQIISIMEPTQ